MDSGVGFQVTRKNTATTITTITIVTVMTIGIIKMHQNYLYFILSPLKRGLFFFYCFSEPEPELGFSKSRSGVGCQGSGIGRSITDP
jgi:hypothetical protein